MTVQMRRLTRLRACAAVLAAVALVGCSSPQHRAPVDERSPTAGRGPAASVDAGKSMPGAENAGKPGYYTVKPGDTIMRIGLETGLSWRDIAKWNNLDNANVIEPGQVLRVTPPGVDPNGPTTKPVTIAKIEGRSLDAKPGNGASAPGLVTPQAAPAAAAAASEADENVVWIWPANGTVIAGFDELRNKGIGIAGKVGDSVYSAADGRVIYAGPLRGYGNLVIVKHNDTYLTAYAHNQILLAKEDQPVRKGQKIAEMGSTDTDRVKLHFEIRKLGKPVDPTKYLPAR